MAYLTHLRPGHEYNNYERDELIKSTIYYHMWPLSTLMTLVYTWQYYDMVETVANKKVTSSSFWMRTSLVVILVLATMISTRVFDYYFALSIWYFEPSSGHLNLKLANHYINTQKIALFFIASSVCLCCIVSAGFLGGVIYWAHQMTITKDMSELRAGSINYLMVFVHIGLILLQACVIYFYVSA